jgi:pimeloyl-ACP methyl ester carboxylesterase
MQIYNSRGLTITAPIPEGNAPSSSERIPMRKTLFNLCSICLLSTLLCISQGKAVQDPTDQSALRAGMKRFEEKLAALQALPPEAAARLADAELFYKSVVWALRYEPTLSPADLALLRKAMARGIQRLDALQAGKTPWAHRQGTVVRGYVSAVDGSVQPYGLIFPPGYNPLKPIRLDVVLHGSSHPTGLSELHFIAPFDKNFNAGDEDEHAGPRLSDKPDSFGSSFIELHPLGRVENCYRWAGETDVFEAIEDVCRNYNIDRSRIVLRGMSMGASGTWHLGLKHPDRFVALGPYCGYVDTHQFSETPGMNFVKVGPLPPHQEIGLHMLDSVDYAANAGVVPAIAAIGDRDTFFQAHVIMGEAMQREGLRMVNLISPGTGHVQDPVTFGEQMRRIGIIAAPGSSQIPRHLRFVTWTLKYNKCHWIEILGLGQHYARAEVEATVAADSTVNMGEPKNVTCFAILPPMLQEVTPRLNIGGKPVRLPAHRGGEAPEGVVLALRNGRWVYAGSPQGALSGKRPHLQGPIDDAFTTPFLCVRGTGKPWNPKVQAWADANLKRFAYEWNRYFRGDIRIKNDSEVTEEDLKNYNLILFGDPGSNLWIKKALPSLPLRWSKKEVLIAGKQYSAADYAPAAIYPSPFSRNHDRYIVLNSGHTFHEAELNRLNYLLFPRLGDWAVMKLGDNGSKPVQEEAVEAGYFNEQWKFSQTGYRN